MAGGADGGGGEGVFLRVLADEVEQVLEVVRGHARRGADDQRPVRQQRYRGEVLHHVIGHALVQERIDDVDRGRQQEGVAVGRGLRDRVGADRSGRAAGPVLDDEVLAQRLVELLHQDAGDAVDRSAGRERHHDGDRARGIGLGGGRRGQQRKERERERRNRHGLHWDDPFEHCLICPRIASPVDQQILAGDETGMVRAQKRAIGAELRRPAVAFGGIGRGALAPDLVEALAGFRRACRGCAPSARRCRRCRAAGC